MITSLKEVLLTPEASWTSELSNELKRKTNEKGRSRI